MDGFIIRRGGVGGDGGVPFAIIGVETPDGATITAVSGSKTVSTKSVDGYAILNIPSTGVWNLTSTLGEKSTTLSATINNQYQVVKVSMPYEFNIYYRGERAIPCFETRYQFNGKTAGTLTQGTTNISIKHTGTASGSAYSAARGTCVLTNSAVDLTNYSKYGIHISGGSFGGAIYDDYQQVYAFITDTKGASTASNRLKASSKSPRTGANDIWLWVDISEITGSHYLGFGMLSSGGGLSYDITVKVDQVSLV